MDFNEKLASLRRAKGFSQEQLADLLNISRQAISKWETAESQPDLAKLILLSNVFEISLDELCGRTTETITMPPANPTKPHSRFVWTSVLVIILSIIIGFTGGIFLPTSPQKEIESVSIVSCDINSELYKEIIHLVFCPSITFTPGNNNSTYSCKILKIDSYGKVSSYPAIFTDGVYRSDVDVDFLYSDFTLNAVISDGNYDYTLSLAKMSIETKSSCTIWELWNK